MEAEIDKDADHTEDTETGQQAKAFATCALEDLEVDDSLLQHSDRLWESSDMGEEAAKLGVSGFWRGRCGQ